MKGSMCLLTVLALAAIAGAADIIIYDGVFHSPYISGPQPPTETGNYRWYDWLFDHTHPGDGLASARAQGTGIKSVMTPGARWNPNVNPATTLSLAGNRYIEFDAYFYHGNSRIPGTSPGDPPIYRKGVHFNTMYLQVNSDDGLTYKWDTGVNMWVDDVYYSDMGAWAADPNTWVHIKIDLLSNSAPAAMIDLNNDTVGLLRFNFPVSPDFHVRNARFTGAGTANAAPSVDAGEDQTIMSPSIEVTLDGSVTDDGLPDPPGAVTTTWEQLGGPATATLADIHAPITTATFSEVGVYEFRLTAYDGEFTVSDTVRITVKDFTVSPGTWPILNISFPNHIAAYNKFEITFDVNTVATNLQLPYDSTPPTNITPGVGVSVDAEFTPDNWVTTYTQPAFYYQYFIHEMRGSSDWIYPEGNYAWKVRFAAPTTGEWKFKLVVQDAGGTYESDVYDFTVAGSDNPGFIRVSAADERYFEFENGEPFYGLGHNFNWGWLSWDDPSKAENVFQTVTGYGMNHFRTWINNWGIYGATSGAWNSPETELHAVYFPYQALWMPSDVNTPDPVDSGVCMRLRYGDHTPVMWLGHNKRAPAVKRGTNYAIFVEYYIPATITGPRSGSGPYGLVCKTSSWNNYLYDSGQGTVVSNYAYQATNEWTILTGSFNSGSSDWIPGGHFSLCLENVNEGAVVYINKVEIRENLGGGQYGPNIVNHYWFSKHLYVDQRYSYSFDKILELAENYGIYFQLVLLEKHCWIANRINDLNENDPLNPSTDNIYFYGYWTVVGKVRWLQQAFWRYCQARWGYSTSIRAWELLNEGDPWHGRHYTLADECAKYMHQFAPNHHMVSTSNWHSFPKDEFWASPDYPDVDYADYHRACPETTHDIAAHINAISMDYGAKRPGGAGKPLVLGESNCYKLLDHGLQNDTQRIWYHNHQWANINHGGMYQLYWSDQGEFGWTPDPRAHNKPYADFLKGIPLNNGHYEALSETITGSNIRVLGQKDLVNERAHLWIQNDQHTWYNIVNSNPMPAVSGTVELAGFKANKKYRVEWFDTYATASRTAVFENGDFVSPWVSAPTGGSYSDLPFETSTAPDGSAAAYADIWPGNEGLWTKVSAGAGKDIGGNCCLEFDIYFDTASSPGHTLAAMHMEVNGDGGWTYKWENESRCWVDGVLTDMDDGVPGNDLPMTGNRWHHFKLDLLDNTQPSTMGQPTPLPENPDIGIIRMYFEDVNDGADVYIRNMCFTNGSDSEGVILSTEYLTTDGDGKLTLSVTDLSTDIAVKVKGLGADLTNDMYVDCDDLSILADNWLGTGAGGADIAPPDSPDGIVNFLDFAKLAQTWLEGI